MVAARNQVKPRQLGVSREIDDERPEFWVVIERLTQTVQRALATIVGTFGQDLNRLGPCDRWMLRLRRLLRRSRRCIRAFLGGCGFGRQTILACDLRRALR